MTMRDSDTPPYFVSAAIVDSHSGGFIGVTHMGAWIGDPPVDLPAVVALGAELTANAHERALLPLNHRYQILNWQEFGKRPSEQHHNGHYGAVPRQPCPECKTTTDVHGYTCEMDRSVGDMDSEPHHSADYGAATEVACGPVKDGGWHCRPWRCDQASKCPLNIDGGAQ